MAKLIKGTDIMRFLKFIIFSAFFLFGNVSNSFASELGWKIIKGNNVVFGQILGCLIRLKTYPEFISEDSMVKAFDARIYLDNYMPSIDETIEKLGEIGMKAGHLTEEVNLSFFTDMISDVAKMEAESGVSWLQAIGCYKQISDMELMSE